MPGTSWLKHPQTPPFKPGIHRAQRFVELDLLPALPAKAVPVPGYPPQREWAAGLAEVAWLRRELDAAGQAEQPVLALGDGAYSGQGAWQALAEGVTLLARCPRNRALFRLPPPYPGRGRPRLYGERAPRPDAWLAEGAGWARTELAVRGRTIPVGYRVEGPYVVRGAPERPLFLLVVRGSDPRRGRRRREPAFWLVGTAPDGAGGWRLPWSAERLLAWAWQRWEAEVAHREAKTGFGLGEPQCWGPRSAVLAVQWVAWLYALVVLAGLRVRGQERGPPPPPGRWWRGSGRWSLAQLWSAVRAEVWELGDFRPGWSRSTGRWDEMLDWLALRTNALRGASRT